MGLIILGFGKSKWWSRMDDQKIIGKLLNIFTNKFKVWENHQLTLESLQQYYFVKGKLTDKQLKLAVKILFRYRGILKPYLEFHNEGELFERLITLREVHK